MKIIFKKYSLLIITLFVTISCTYPELIRDELIYENDFESGSLNNIDGGIISQFNDGNVIGDFNNDGFTLHLDNIGQHEYLFISFTIYVHGTWDGNLNGFQNDKPDLWVMELKPEMDLFNDTSSDIFMTTFSNSPCFTNYCLRQSFPDSYPSDNPPQTGARFTDFEGKCPKNFFGGSSSLYSIEKVFKSSGNSAVIRFYDQLYQPNAVDKDGKSMQKCDESWSLDNLKVRALNYK